MEEKLITAVANHPELYDASCYFYRDRNKKDRAWRHRSEEIGQPVVHKVKVHIVTAGETFGADNVLLSDVKDLAGLQVESTDQQGCSIIILFCPISSCVGSDMKAAMKKVSGDKPVILVLMHHTRNPEYSTCGGNWCSVYQNVVLVVHVLFHESVKGLLRSSKNNEAVQQICNKLLQYSSISRLRNDQGTQDMSQFSRRTVEEAHEVVHKVKVHIVTAGETFGADNVLLSDVRDLAGLQVESTDQQGCSIIILFCPISSCVGSDMKAAMKKVSGDKPVILVLMHHTRNPDYSTCGESQCSVYQNVVLVVHVLFHESVKGLLRSSKNSEAVRQIHYKLLQYSSISRLRNDQGTQDMSQLS
ncbi:unnamed protein product [Oreochromis niloticus]|nr:unnamed protein product [Mustela putorius furo]